jgi:transcriptional regulator with XRE-family HTH domain
MAKDEVEWIEQGKRVDQVIKALGISSKQFAKTLGFSQPFISQIKNGRQSITHQFATKLSRTYSVSLEWLSDGKGQMFKEDTPKMVMEKHHHYGKNRPIVLQDLAEIILSIQEENKELRRRLNDLEKKINDSQTNLLP